MTINNINADITHATNQMAIAAKVVVKKHRNEMRKIQRLFSKLRVREAGEHPLQKLADNIVDNDPEFQKVIEENFEDLIGKDAREGEEK